MDDEATRQVREFLEAQRIKMDRPPPLAEIFAIQDDAALFEELLFHLVVKGHGPQPESMTRTEALLLSASEVDAEVNCGGFEGYFFNDGGDQTEEAARALETVGAPKSAEIVRRASRLFAEDPWERGDERWFEMERLLPARYAQFSSLASEFVTCGEDRPALFGAYARAHRSDITPALPGQA